MINWKVRVRNKLFWLSIIPALAILAQAIAAVFGYKIDLDEITARLIDVVYAVFSVLVIMGIVTDPTTEGMGDSDQALGYDEPRRHDTEVRP